MSTFGPRLLRRARRGESSCVWGGGKSLVSWVNAVIIIIMVMLVRVHERASSLLLVFMC